MKNRYIHNSTLIAFSEVMSASPNTADSASDTAQFPQDDSESEPLSEDTIFHLLQVQRRRLTLLYLQNRTDTVLLRDLAEQVAAWENDTTVEQLSSPERQRVYIALYQTHLSKLDTEGVIDYNKDRGTIQRTPRANQLDPYLPTDVQHHTTGSAETQPVEPGALNQRWEWYYLGGTVFSMGLLGAKLFHLPLMSHLVNQLVIPVILLVFSVITACYQYACTAVSPFASTTEE